MLFDAISDLLAAGWLAVPFLLCFLLALPLGVGTLLARAVTAPGHWLPRKVGLTTALLVFLCLSMWVPLATGALDEARLALKGADTATRAAMFASHYSAAMYTLAAGLPVLVFGLGSVLVGALGAHQRGAPFSFVLAAGMCVLLGMVGAVSLQPSVSGLLHAFRAIAFADPAQKDPLMHAFISELREMRTLASMGVSGVAFLAAALSVLVARKTTQAMPRASLALCVLLLAGGSYAYASTRGLARDAALHFPVHQAYPGTPPFALARIGECGVAEDDPARKDGVLWAGFEQGELTNRDVLLRRAEEALKEGRRQAVVVIEAAPDTRSDELARQLSPLAGLPFESIALRSWVSAPRSLTTSTAGKLTFQDFCTVALPVPSQPRTVQELVSGAAAAAPSDWRDILRSGHAQYCEGLEAQARALLEPHTGCESDDDCVVASLPGGCPRAFACSVFVNFVTDRAALGEAAEKLSSLQQRSGCACARPVAECSDPGAPVCREGRCARAEAR